MIREQSALYEWVKIIERSGRLSGAEKRARIDRLRARRSLLAQRVTDRMMAAR